MFMKLIVRSFGLICFATFLTTSIRAAQADARLSQIAAVGLQNEDKVSSGNIKFNVVEENSPLSPAQLHAILKDDQEYATNIDIQKNTPSIIHKKIKFIFDKKLGLFVNDGVSLEKNAEFRVALSSTRLQSYTNAKSAQADQQKIVFVDRPIQFLGVKELPWSGQLWHALMTYNRLSASEFVTSNIGNDMVQVNLPSTKPGQLNRKVTVNTKQGNSIVKVEFSDKGTGAIDSIQDIAYQEYSHGIWYPKIMTLTQFQNINHAHIQTERTTMKAVEVALNPTLSQADLAFGDIPQGTFVQDNRFSPPLAYIQNTKQYTDEELFAMSKNPHRLVQSVVTPRRNGVGIAVLVLGILLIIASVLILRNRR